MAIEDFFEQRCSIYHLEKIVVDMGYGITSTKYGYPEGPNIENVPCHFNVERHFI